MGTLNKSGNWSKRANTKAGMVCLAGIVTVCVR